jgi:uncharacterized DUF497 family protein
MKLRFTWDPQKNAENVAKHGVSFEEATTVFHNFPIEIFFDPDHSVSEHRYIAVGFSDRGRALLVIHCENKLGTVIRIISARRPTRREAKQLFGGRRL